MCPRRCAWLSTWGGLSAKAEWAWSFAGEVVSPLPQTVGDLVAQLQVDLAVKRHRRVEGSSPTCVGAALMRPIVPRPRLSGRPLDMCDARSYLIHKIMSI